MSPYCAGLLSLALLPLLAANLVQSKPAPPDKLEEDHNFKIQIDGANDRPSVDGSYNLDLVRQDGTRQKITSKGPTVQGTYEYLDAKGQKHAVNYEASREGGFRILNPDEAEGLREIPADAVEQFHVGQLKVSESHATTLEFHRRAVEKAWKDQELHSLGVNTLKERFGGGLINASLRREKDPNSNAIHSIYRKEFRDSNGRLRGFQQAHAIVHTVNTSALLNGTNMTGPGGAPIPFPFMVPGASGEQQRVGREGMGGLPFNLHHVVDKIREFHQQLFGQEQGAGNGTLGAGFGPMVPPPVLPFGVGHPDENRLPSNPANEKVPENRAPPV